MKRLHTGLAALLCTFSSVACANEDDSLSEELFLLTRCVSLQDCFARFAATSDEGATLLVYRFDGTLVAALESGQTTRDRYIPIFSASKWITATTILAGVDGSAPGGAVMTLNDTAQTVLGGVATFPSGLQNAPLRDLLAFTSPFYSSSNRGSQDACIQNLATGASAAEKNACIQRLINNATQNVASGASFNYNSNHMAVAQRMLEVQAAATWQNYFNAAVANKLGFDTAQAIWYASITDASGDGSLAGAYGLRLSAAHYARFLQMIANGGTFNAQTILATATVNSMNADQYATNTTIGYSQFAAFGYSWHYGFGNWLFCGQPGAAACANDLVNHSFGANGFYPWIDSNRRYFAVLAVNNVGRTGNVGILPASSSSLFFVESIKPFLHQLL
jgi:CubicO group peptidase (beta-lactamase class C family)